jgi:D-amino-acid dehydrogenase
MNVIVLGAGLLGVTSAYFLRQQGHDVTVVDRQATPAAETSFANGGQISVSQAEPWSNPGAPAKILKWLGDEEAPLLFRPMASRRQWAWGLRFLYECLPGRTRANTLQILQLAIYSGAQLKLLRENTGIRYDHLERGLLQVNYDTEGFERAKQRAELIRNRGLDVEMKDAQQCLALEPALGYSKVKPVGGTYAPSDESGDAHLFTCNLAHLCAQRGV